MEVLLHPKADKALGKLDGDVESRIRDKLRTLEEDPEGGKPLTGGKYWRLRVGDYRAIYEIDRENGRVVVLFVGHRSDVYDDFSRLI